jgi:hypothetical protein
MPPPPPHILCPRCGAMSYHPMDITERYCGNCNEYHDDQPVPVLRQALLIAFATAGVPAHLQGGLLRYFCDRILPGSFLQAVLCNDLAAAVRRGDPTSLAGLVRLVKVLEVIAPIEAWGSREAVLTWTVTPDRLEV